MYKIGIVGKGYVGGAMYENFRKIFYVKVHDKDINKSDCSLKELVDYSDIIFISVPTPMRDSGSCDSSIVENIVKEIAELNVDKIIVIKSTVPPHTSKRLREETGLNIVFNPEFLTEANYIEDFKWQQQIIIGSENEMAINKLKNLYSEFNKFVGNKNCKIEIKTSSEAEAFKYLANCFLSMKIIFANEFKMLCNSANITYENIIDLAQNDTRLGKTHWQVPGPDGKWGYGGSCFPKDTNALNKYAESYNINLKLLSKMIEINSEIRR